MPRNSFLCSSSGPPRGASWVSLTTEGAQASTGALTSDRPLYTFSTQPWVMAPSENASPATYPYPRQACFATWNVRTLMDSADSDRPARCTALVAAQLNRYNIDIAALSETRFADEGSLSLKSARAEPFFWKRSSYPQVLALLYGLRCLATFLKPRQQSVKGS